jgi:hypothetical protein
MIIYLPFINYDLWLSIENGPYRPIKIDNGIEILKSRTEYGDKKLLSINAKAINTLYCVLNISEFIIITSCKNTRDTWHALDASHDETSQVK